MEATPDKPLTLEAFLPHVKTKFRAVPDDGGPVELELTEAANIAGSHNRVPNKSGMVQDVFSLIFEGPESRFLPQRTYPFEHEQLGRFDLFMVPVEKIAGGFRYQVIINRLVKADGV